MNGVGPGVCPSIVTLAPSTLESPESMIRIAAKRVDLTIFLEKVESLLIRFVDKTGALSIARLEPPQFGLLPSNARRSGGG